MTLPHELSRPDERSRRAQPTATNGERRRWWHGAVVYENHLPSFRDGDGDGIGDLAGLVESLDYLADTLGVDAVWTGPFFRSPLLDNGYDVSDHGDVEPVFGDLATFDRLVTEAHRRGLRVIVDYIPNHTSDQHRWFTESRSSRDNPRHDWYIWRDARPDDSPPNNWTSEAGGSVWQWEPRRQQYYLHSHLVEQPDLNWRNPDVRAAMLDVLRLWMERGADGVRIDVAHLLMKHPELPDHPPATDTTGNPFDLQHPDFGSQLHIYDRRHADTAATMSAIRTVLDDYPESVAIAEIEAMPWDEWAAYFGTADDGIHLPFPFRLIETRWHAAELHRELTAMYHALPAGGWPIVALGNHDRSRLASRLGVAQARVAATLLLTLRATPCLLYADELGYVDHPVPADRGRDYFARSAGGVSRDPGRTPMAWDRGPNAGFSTAPAEQTWLPLPADAAGWSVAAQLSDPGSMLTLYRELLALRSSRVELRDGELELLELHSPDVLAYRRVGGASSVAVVLNLSPSPRALPPGVSGRVLASTTADHVVGEPFGGNAPIAGDTGLVIDEAVQR